MIKGTTANCKIKSITVTDSTATITCIIYSLSPAKQHKAFKFFLRDKDKTITAVSENIYWIDRINNYNNDSINIDVNQYLETQFSIDITNNNTAEVIDNKWVRNCNLILRDLDQPTNTYAWVSEDLTLVSKEFEIPNIYNLDIHSDKNFNLYISYDYKYKSQADFNYNNSNLYATIKVLSIYTNTLLDSIDIAVTSTHVDTKFLATFNTPIKVIVELKNSKGQKLSILEKLYTPMIKRSDTFIKTAKGIQRILAYYIKDNIIYNDTITATKQSTTTYSIKVAQDIDETKETPSLKVNFNNAEVKQPVFLEPSIYLIGSNILRIKNPNISSFDTNKISLYIEDTLVADSTHGIMDFNISNIETEEPLQSINLKIEIEGTSSHLTKSTSITQTIRLIFLCSDNYLCSEQTICF